MMPRGAGSGTSRSRFVSDWSAVLRVLEHLGAEERRARNTSATDTMNVAALPRRWTSLGWKLMRLCGSSTGGRNIRAG